MTPRNTCTPRVKRPLETPAHVESYSNNKETAGLRTGQLPTRCFRDQGEALRWEPGFLVPSALASRRGLQRPGSSESLSLLLSRSRALETGLSERRAGAQGEARNRGCCAFLTLVSKAGLEAVLCSGLSSGRLLHAVALWPLMSPAPFAVFVLGVWPEGSDGTDINAVCRAHEKKLLSTGDDFGKVHLFSYPCSQFRVNGLFLR